MNKLSREKRSQILGILVEGGSLRSANRMAEVSINTVTKLLLDLGRVCSDYQARTLVSLHCKRIQADEIWNFCYAKRKNVPDRLRGQFGYGDIWTFTAICADSKLIVSWLIGPRDGGSATEFMQDVAGRVLSRVQLTANGNAMYLSAVEDAFGVNVDFAQLQKVYGVSAEGETRYSPPECIGVRCDRIQGNPQQKHISTSYVERQNLTMRMGMRRYTRLTNAFSKKIENQAAAVALHFMHYNFCRIHKTLRVTPAMEAGVSNHVWTLEEVIDLLESSESAVQGSSN